MIILTDLLGSSISHNYTHLLSTLTLCHIWEMVNITPIPQTTSQGRKAYTTFRKARSTQRQFKIGVPQVIVLSYTLFNILICRRHHNDCNTHQHTDITSPYTIIPTRQPYLKSHLKSNNFILNSGKMSCNRLAEYNTRLNLQINNTILYIVHKSQNIVSLPLS